MTNSDSQTFASPSSKTLPLIAWGSLLFGCWPIGFAIAYIDRGKAPEIFASHYTYLIRTIWIGLLFGTVSFVLSFVGIGIIGLFAVSLWYFIRSVKGLVFLLRDQRIDKPNTWLI
jgi:uncharacterized membrane protein